MPSNYWLITDFQERVVVNVKARFPYGDLVVVSINEECGL